VTAQEPVQSPIHPPEQPTQLPEQPPAQVETQLPEQPEQPEQVPVQLPVHPEEQPPAQLPEQVLQQNPVHPVPQPPVHVEAQVLVHPVQPEQPEQVPVQSPHTVAIEASAVPSNVTDPVTFPVSVIFLAVFSFVVKPTTIAAGCSPSTVSASRREPVPSLLECHAFPPPMVDATFSVAIYFLLYISNS
jgi:hypothetical protein